MYAINHSYPNLSYDIDYALASMIKYIKSNSGQNYPRFNIIENDKSYTLEFALAGFKKDELSVKSEDNLLKISGSSNSTKQRNYIYRGIALRNFEVSYDIGNKLKVSNVNFEDGILKIELEKIIPPGKELKVWI